jgi:Holliday junction resolvase
MIKAYSKGSRAERELAHFLNHKGFATLRVPSSGGFLSPLDVVAIRRGQILAFEIKSHAKKPRLKRDQLERFTEWCTKANALGFVAWRRTSSDNDEPLSASQRWMFLPIENAQKNDYADISWVERDVLFLKVFGIE